MAISISEALQLPIMKKTQLVAGHSGLSKRIKWVTIVEVIEDTSRLQDGEFLITTGFGLDKNVESQENFRQLLKLNRLSGVALYTGFYIHEIPESFIEVANESGLPLIEIPNDINFSMITKEILEQIVNNQIQLLEYSVKIHKELTKHVLNNHSLLDITKTLSSLTSATIIIYSDLNEIVNSYSLPEAGMSIESFELFLNSNSTTIESELKKCKEKKEMKYLNFLNYDLTICPIITKEHCYGYILAIKPNNQWREMDAIAIEHAATVYAIEHLKQVAVEETQLRLQGDFLDDIINNQYTNKDTVLEQARKLGYDLSAKQTVFFITFKLNNRKKQDMGNFFNKLFQIVNQVLKQKKITHAVRSKLDSLILLTEAIGNNQKEIHQYCLQLALDIEKQWLYFFPKIPIYIGIGRSYDEINDLSKSVIEAQQAVRLSNLLFKPTSIIHYDDLGMYHLLLEMRESGINLENLYFDCLGTLIDHTRRGTDLLETLEVYLNNNQSIQATASELYIHRHTLKYRLKQIEEKTGYHLKSADERMKLQLALMAFKLVNQLNQIDSNSKE
ncbi:PucR family transcriptional regulator [Anaerobacillus sp. MEB173]|uniref:PucR family transcriptional regulator n=1 Tax=Anaerobacillus sp. MEB173 TaxID=3383345 RepID=UPI003F900C6D